MLKHVKRLMGGVAAIGLALIMLPTPVFAAEGDVAQIGDQTYATLDAAIADAEDGATIELLGDATTEGMNLSKSLTIQASSGLAEKPTLTFTDKGIALWGKTLEFKNIDAIMNGVGSTPYTAEWNWMSICASTDAILTLNNVNMTMDATGTTNSPHAIYFCNNNVLNVVNGSNLTIKNYVNDALEWDGGDGGYNVNITDSTFVSDHNRSGFTGTFYATITNSDVDVINSRGNGSNGTHFIIDNSNVNFSDNTDHGLSTGELTIKNNSKVFGNNNGRTGVHVGGGNFSIDGTSTLQANGNGCKNWGAGINLTASGTGTVKAGAIIEIVGNGGDGLDNQRTTIMEEGAKVTITNNSDGNGGGIYNPGNLTLPSDAVVYNNHATTSGSDIYSTGTITFGQVGTDWKLDGVDCDGNPADCIDAIDGWYDDSKDARWEAHASTYDDLHVEEYTFEGATTTVTGPLALKAAHGLLPASVQPADITIYMGGDEGFEGVIDDNNEITGSDSLPEPGFYITLPDSVNAALGALVGTADEPANLSNYIQVYVPSDDPSTARHWTLEQYGNTYSAANGKYIYRIVPAEGQDPIRLEFTDEDGNTYVSDEFDPMAEEALHRTYGMSLYAGGVDFAQLVMQVTVPDNGGTFYCAVNTVPGTLNVRYVTGEQDDVVTGVITDIADAEQAGERAYAQVSESTKFFINGSDIDVTDVAAPSLLFDDVVTDADIDGATYDQQLANRAADVIRNAGNDLGASYFEAKYLDLVDANNGNAWLTSSEPVTVYWPYPEGTDQDTEFHLVHFQGLDRELETSAVEGAIANASTQYVEVENTEHGIRFTTDGFSPFVLVWEQPGQDTPTTPEEPVTPEKPSTDQKPTTGNIPATGDTALMTAATVLVAAVAVAGTGLVLQRRKR